MSFTELTFVFIVLPLSVISALSLKWLRNERIRNLIILILSIGIFAYYSRNALTLFVLFICLTYLLGNLIHASKEKKDRKKWMILSVAFLVAILAYSKYIPGLITWWNGLGLYHLKYKSIIVITGISFLVFSAISYIVDIYRGDAEPGSFIDAALFLSFFPKFVSGPIVLWKDFRKELQKTSYPIDKISSGIDRIIIGFGKKLIIADTLGAHIAFIRTNSSGVMDTRTVWLLAICYFFEIYYDFSGYSDIAIGLCRLFGFDVKENFNFPYISRSVTEFWRRWHISLGTWFKEYVYIPLGGNRTGNVYFNLFVVFLLTGIWHGANYTFVIWGLAHGAVMLFERAVKDKKWYKKIPSVVKWAFSMFFVFLAWILFMSPDIGSAGTIIKSLFSHAKAPVDFTWRFFATRKIVLILLAAGIGSLGGLLLEKKGAKERISSWMERPYITGFKKLALLALFVIDILFLVNSSYSPFIYMQF